ncbi:phage portal protein [Intestinimonas butyriciproducens]|uniref:A118 family predicted phage portal protein n=1 Tax=Intestinimonas butyriciproducens TaxID=1297617 RepID=A0A2U1BEK0_9FIRM|nr:phage portal protein [Intestinimonas butyriciproducens]MCR1905178.1 phage portal protein [Intestinimonas butyriciproducens]PVY47056.1 A118 family predicted phage portal protein [Intestinimonas butyriciproducens]QBB65798.1 Portal protein [Intestinimonas butyriciproducens]
MNITEKLKELGYSTVPEEFYTKVQEWKSWYEGDVKGFHRYRVRNGAGMVRCKRYTLNMGKKIPEDWANLLMNEKVKITLEGQKEQEFIDWVFEENNFRVKSNEMQEKAFALGTVAFIPRVVGMEATEEGPVPGSADGIVMDYVTVEHIWPLSWQNGIISECAFSSTVTVNGEDFCYLQIHHKVNGLYDIENRIYRYRNGNVDSEVALTDVAGFERVPQVVHTESDRRQFVIDRPNIANNYDDNIPLGVSVFSSAIDVLKGVDVAYDSYVNEFVLGKKRVMVKPSATSYLDGEPVFDSDDLVFYVLPEDIQDGAVITPIDMTLRTQEHNTGIQDQLNLLSSKCGFGENHYRFGQGSVATATQVISENSTMFRTIKKHEIILEQVLTELCRIMLRLGNTAMNAGLNEDVEISIDFDDSIIEDKQSDFSRDMQLLNAGIMNDWEFRSKWMNEDEATAKKMLPKMEDMTDEEEEEIE